MSLTKKHYARRTEAMYIYQAELWCDDCAELIKERLDAEGKTPESPDDEKTFDSDDYPKGPFADGEEADGPQFCAGGDDCPNAVEVKEEDHKVGMPFGNSLTDEGERYAKELYEQASPGMKAILELYWDWLDYEEERGK